MNCPHCGMPIVGSGRDYGTQRFDCGSETNLKGGVSDFGRPSTCREIARLNERVRVLEEGRTWVSVSDKLPTKEGEDNKHALHIHCWCAVSTGIGFYVKPLAWNPYHRCWDDSEEDDIAEEDSRVAYWQPMYTPTAPSALGGGKESEG